jgi:hypothetical protein
MNEVRKEGQMPRTIVAVKVLTILCLLLAGCESNEADENTPTANETVEQGVERIGFELVEILSATELLVWMNDEPLSQEEFDAIQTPPNWRKNEPREGDPDGSTFFRSPDASQAGMFTREQHFGYQWLFNAQIVQQDVALPGNADRKLNGRYIAKYHRVHFKAGRTLHILISPDGDEYVRISRDANRTTDTPTIPASWRLEARVIGDDLSIDLPNPTLNIRAESNQDSFQGPVILSRHE